MRVVIFFVCLFLLLLGGYTYVYTGGQNSIHNTAQLKIDQKKFSNTVKEASADKEEEYLIGNNVEDDDDNDPSARKYKLLTRFNTTFSSPCYLHSCPKAHPAFCSLLSYKYITQGVLRI